MKVLRVGSAAALLTAGLTLSAACFGAPREEAEPRAAVSAEARAEKARTADTRAAEVQTAFRAACDAYRRARAAEAADVRGEAYAEAIRAVGYAAELAPDDAEVLLLASQIYRGKGGLSYARRYFERAEAVFLARLAERPKDAGAHLDYAIACYAGVPRFEAKYGAYAAKAEQYAGTALKLCGAPAGRSGKDRRIAADSVPAAKQRIAALAYLVLDERETCEALLEQAAERDASARDWLALFRDTVARGRWLWPAGKDADKEFLLYLLTDAERYEDMERQSGGS